MDDSKDSTSGLLSGSLAVILWGVLPIYWKSLSHFNAELILCHRIIWSVIFLLIIIWKNAEIASVLKTFRDSRTLLALVVSGFIIGINWYLFIWSINNNRVLEASMGYFLYPLLSAAMGIVLLKEKMKVLQFIGFLLAFVGVIIMGFTSLRTSWISFGLAISFATYGYLRKIYKVKAIEGLFIEVTILSPFAIWTVLSNADYLTSSFSSTRNIIMLMASGIATALPMALFVYAAKKLTLIEHGMLFYITPTLIFLIAIFKYHEQLYLPTAISFALIWIGIFFYIVYLVNSRKKTT